ncbi:MAG TPA: hypothetical protein VEC01_18395 [Noviherbaspirillum sp.]|uniref:hypothetical protein n=1 Tax=Noviherbaspirillum sp. TaxID=1926288 RepID=UPI002D34C4C9|nr:hypothetical protein [Noviherbaspirillum sp.]HYD97301.1 hypothetical protein [Noviherbaspirillum sp.]
MSVVLAAKAATSPLTRGMAIAAAVKADDASTALKPIGIADTPMTARRNIAQPGLLIRLQVRGRCDSEENYFRSE